jgi:hypothetical protein
MEWVAQRGVNSPLKRSGSSAMDLYFMDHKGQEAAWWSESEHIEQHFKDLWMESIQSNLLNPGRRKHPKEKGFWLKPEKVRFQRPVQIQPERVPVIASNQVVKTAVGKETGQNELGFSPVLPGEWRANAKDEVGPFLADGQVALVRIGRNG